jgi:zinc and cadmium transporter
LNLDLWSTTLALAAAGSLGGLLVASLLLLFHAARTRFLPWMVSFAVGTLLGAALLHLLPDALESLPAPVALGTLLAGILTFFVLEKLVVWRHSHEGGTPHIHHSTATLIVVGDAVHTMVDGLVIAAASMTSVALGATTALAIIAHEIPQEASGFAVLLAAGHSRRRAFLKNLTSALGSVVGAAAMLAFGHEAPRLVPYVLAFAAGNFLYVAMADLIPSLHRGDLDDNGFRQFILIALGVLTIAAL